MLKITYGRKNDNIDVTNICLRNLMKQNIIKIPKEDENRVKYFTDPLPDMVKAVFVVIDDSPSIEVTRFKEAFIDLNLRKIFLYIIPNHIKMVYEMNVEERINKQLDKYHETLSLRYGTFSDELPEQKMAVRYLKGHEKVLELGANIGRNSLIISKILNNSNNLVAVETDPMVVDILRSNRHDNNVNFIIEKGAISKRKLIQEMDKWQTIVSDEVLPNYRRVKNISLQEIKKKNNIEFDTLVLDCEGSFYYILIDFPEILDGINLIIMENDYDTPEKKKYVDDKLTENNFYVDYSEPLYPFYGGEHSKFAHVQEKFYEVWKRDTTGISLKLG
jgi:FkbM family methyltransferase